jgi:acetyltransferase
MIAEIDEEQRRKIIGVSRLILQPDRKCGEFAVVVGDKWQGQGLGSRMVDSIIEIGRDLGLDVICGDVMSNNVKMLHLCTKKGFKMEAVDEEISKATLDLRDHT